MSLQQLRALSTKLDDAALEITLLKRAFEALPMGITIYRLEEEENPLSLRVLFRSPYGIKSTRLKDPSQAPDVVGKRVDELPEFGTADLYVTIRQALAAQEDVTFDYHAPETVDAVARDFHITIGVIDNNHAVMAEQIKDQ